MATNVTGMTPSVQAPERSQETKADKLSVRRDGGNSGAGFSPRTDVNLKTSIDNMAEVLSKISSHSSEAENAIPSQLKEIINNIMRSAFSLDSTVGEGVGSSLASQKFSVEQLNTLSRILHNLGYLSDQGSLGELSEDLQVVFDNLKGVIGKDVNYEPVNLNKLAFQLVQDEDNVQAAKQLEQILAQVASAAGQAVGGANNAPASEGFSLLNKLVDAFFPKAMFTGGTEQGAAQTGNGANMANANATGAFMGNGAMADAMPNNPGMPGNNMPQGNTMPQGNGAAQGGSMPNAMPQGSNNPPQVINLNQGNNMGNSMPESGMPNTNTNTAQPPMGQGTATNGAANSMPQGANQGMPANAGGQPMANTSGQPMTNAGGQPMTNAMPEGPMAQGQPMAGQGNAGSVMADAGANPANTNQTMAQPAANNGANAMPQGANQGTPANAGGQPMVNTSGQPMANVGGQPMANVMPEGPMPQGQPMASQGQPGVVMAETGANPANANQTMAQPAPTGAPMANAAPNTMGSNPTTGNTMNNLPLGNEPFMAKDGTMMENGGGAKLMPDLNQGNETINLRLNNAGMAYEGTAARQAGGDGEINPLFKQIFSRFGQGANLQNNGSGSPTTTVTQTIVQMDSPQVTAALKDVGQLILKNAELSPKDAELLTNFVNNNQGELAEQDAKQLNLLLRTIQGSIPASIQQASQRQGMEGLPKLWAFMQLCDIGQLKKMKGHNYRNASKQINNFVASMKGSMTSEGSYKADGQKSISFMMPLYCGDGTAQSYPAYIHIYDEPPHEDERGVMRKDTWFRVCVLTESIGAVDVVCRLYEGNNLNLRVIFSDQESVTEFSDYLPDIRKALYNTPINLTDLKIGTVNNAQ